MLLNINTNFKKHIKKLVHKPHKTTKHNGELAVHEICKGDEFEQTSLKKLEHYYNAKKLAVSKRMPTTEREKHEGKVSENKPMIISLFLKYIHKI